MRALQLAGVATVLAVVLAVSDLDAQRMEIEENLCRRDLSALDRAVFLNRWQAVHQALEGASKRGGKRVKGQSRKDATLTGGVPAMFAEVAAERLGLSVKHIQRAKRRALIRDDVRAMIAGTWLADHGAELDLLVTLRGDVQHTVVSTMLARGATTIRGIHAEVTGRRTAASDPVAEQFDRMAAAWRKGSPAAHRKFATWLASFEPTALALFTEGEDA